MRGHDDFVLSALLQERLATREQIDAACAQAAARSVSPTQALADMRIVDARTIALIRAGVSECPFVDPTSYDINFANTQKLPRPVAESIRAFPLFVLGDTATVGMADPLDLRAIDQLRTLLKCEIEPVLVEPGVLTNLIDRAYALTAGPRDSAQAQQLASTELEALTTGKEPIVAAVNQIIAQGIDLGASDIHIGPDENELHLRYRVDGSLQPFKGPSVDVHAGLVQRLKVMANLDLTVSRKPQDGKIRFTHNGRTVDIRLSLIPTVTGENVVMRLLASSGSIRGFVELGFPTEEVASFESAIEQPYGMILVTGPTGSGKTTTLYTALKRLNTADRNIMTIEDPVEVRMPLIRQVQVNSEIGMTFAGALRSILRQDPDVVFVGEIRDEETARISVQAALTGHLVLSSLHTNDAAGALPRLRDLGVPPFAVNAALLSVIAQRLVKRVCTDCARPSTPEAALLERFGLTPSAKGFVKGAGCARCGSTGTRGRIGVYEVLRISPGLRKLVDKLAPASEIRRFAVTEGFKEMWRDGLTKAQQGRTTLEEIARIVAVQATETDDAAPATLRSAA
ncbi:MAG: GspE/PulE family protein [Phycisphaerales bacterium]|nr:GspE/PulE family protein [Phycisphaerales bacterium]